MRKWTVKVNTENYESIAESLDKVRKKSINTRLALNFDIEGLFHARQLKLKRKVINDWRLHICHLKIKIYGNEKFLLRPDFIFPKLQGLDIILPEYENGDRMAIMSALISGHAKTLKACGVQNSDYDQLRLLRVKTCLETLRLVRTNSNTTLPLVQYAKNSIVRLGSMFWHNLIPFLSKL